MVDQPRRPAFAVLPDLPLYSDGSCLTPAIAHWAVSGMALVQLDPTGGAVRAITGRVLAGFPQTAAADEHLAILVATKYLPPAGPVPPIFFG